MFALWSPCAKNGCPMPGIVKFEFTEDGQTYTALLCPLCALKPKDLFAGVREVQKQDRLLRRDPGGPIAPEGGPDA